MRASASGRAQGAGCSGDARGQEAWGQCRHKEIMPVTLQWPPHGRGRAKEQGGQGTGCQAGPGENLRPLHHPQSPHHVGAQHSHAADGPCYPRLGLTLPAGLCLERATGEKGLLSPSGTLSSCPPTVQVVLQQ